MCFVKAALPVSTFFTIVTLIFSLDLFSHDGVLVAPPRDARVVAATWRVIVTLHPPQLLPMTDWVAVIRTSIANRPELSDDATRTWWSLRLRRLDGLIPHPGRRRRAIFGFVSEISRVLFGTATESEVDDVRRVVTTVDANQKDIVHNSKELWSLLNGTREYVQQNRRTIFSLAKYSSQMSRLLNWTVQQYHFLTVRVKSLRFMHEIDRAIDHLEFMSDHYSLRWEDYLSGLTSLSEGHLTRQMVSPSVLHGVRARMTARGYDTLPTDWYYRHAETFILIILKTLLSLWPIYLLYILRNICTILCFMYLYRLGVHTGDGLLVLLLLWLIAYQVSVLNRVIAFMAIPLFVPTRCSMIVCVKLTLFNVRPYLVPQTFMLPVFPLLLPLSPWRNLPCPF